MYGITCVSRIILQPPRLRGVPLPLHAMVASKVGNLQMHSKAVWCDVGPVQWHLNVSYCSKPDLRADSLSLDVVLSVESVARSIRISPFASHEQSDMT